eukprot:6209558-Pleurochrysis_carterae.AAC.1
MIAVIELLPPFHVLSLPVLARRTSRIPRPVGALPAHAQRASFSHFTKVNAALQSRQISWNGAGPRGGLALGVMLSKNAILRTLDASQNGIDTMAAMVFASAIRDDNRELTQTAAQLDADTAPGTVSTCSGEPLILSIKLDAVLVYRSPSAFSFAVEWLNQTT